VSLYSCEPPYIVPEISKQSVNVSEIIIDLFIANVPVIAFARFVIVTHNAIALDHQGQSVLVLASPK
jgi:hypothetical protein